MQGCQKAHIFLAAQSGSFETNTIPIKKDLQAKAYKS
jgi:hypothetical protein